MKHKLKELTDLLLNNGFEKIEEDSFQNNKCHIIIDQTHNYYRISNNNGEFMYSDDLNFYWLIGILVYYEYIDDFKKIK